MYICIKFEKSQVSSLVLSTDCHIELRAHSVIRQLQKFRVSVESGSHYQVVQIAIIRAVIEYLEPCA